MTTYFKSGSWNVICAVCGRQFKASDIRKRWDGLLVCHSDYEERHPLDFVRALPERAGVPYANPEPADTFAEVACPFPALAGMADVGTADCARAGYTVTVPAGFLIVANTSSSHS